MRKWFSKLAYIRYRILIIVAASFSIAFFLFAIIILGHQASIYNADLLFNVQSVSDTILKSLEQDMMTNDTISINRTLEAIGEQEVIKELRILNHNGGEVRASMKKQEVGKRFFLQDTAPQCASCHGRDMAENKLSKMLTYEPQPAENGVLGAIIPIRNQLRCSNAACHAHDANQKILGILDVGVCRKQMRDSIRASRIEVLIISALFVLIFPIGIMVFIGRYVTRPLKQLVDSTKKVARGDFHLDLPIHSSDEIGELGISFNMMVGQISKFKEELESLNRGLEKRVEREAGKLKVAQQQVVQAEKMSSIGRLAAVIAHEINNPIAGLVTFARLLLKQLEKPIISETEREKMRERLSLMESEAVRCGGIVSELLTFTREDKKMVDDDLAKIITRSASIVDLRAKEQHVQIRLELEDDLPLIYCDPSKIQQVLMVLLHNAIEAMPGGGEVRIRARKMDGGQIELCVSDDGIGIPKENLPHVFEPFYSSKNHGQSVGIGLFVAYGIIEQHNGTIAVASEENRGTQVVVRLPTGRAPNTRISEIP